MLQRCFFVVHDVADRPDSACCEPDEGHEAAEEHRAPSPQVSQEAQLDRSRASVSDANAGEPARLHRHGQPVVAHEQPSALRVPQRAHCDHRTSSAESHPRWDRHTRRSRSVRRRAGRALNMKRKRRRRHPILHRILGTDSAPARLASRGGDGAWRCIGPSPSPLPSRTLAMEPTPALALSPPR